MGFQGTTDQFCAAAKKEGYDGIEIWWPGEKKDQDELFAALKKHSLEVGFLCGAFQPDWKEHLETFKKVNYCCGNKYNSKTFIYQLPFGKRLFQF